jgi:uncharacterized protein YbaP (TraB family)
MRALLVTLLLLGCQSKSADKKVEKTQPAQDDPWQVKSLPDDPPNMEDRHKRADAACPTVTGPYFYKIEKDGKVSHILGTRHVGVSLKKFPKPVRDAIATAKLAVFETAPDDNSDYSAPEIDLPKALGEANWTRFRKLVGERLARTLEHAEPSLAVLTMIAMYEDVTATLDNEIEDEVTTAKIPTRGLEASEMQRHLIAKIMDLRLLKAMIEGTPTREELADASRKDLTEYCAGTDDTPGMDEDNRKDMIAAGYTEADIAALEEEMVFARNADWIPKLETILADGDVFIAVGADQLTGPRGVVALLEMRGYKLTRVTK